MTVAAARGPRPGLGARAGRARAPVRRRAVGAAAPRPRPDRRRARRAARRRRRGLARPVPHLGPHRAARWSTASPRRSRRVRAGARLLPALRARRRPRHRADAGHPGRLARAASASAGPAARLLLAGNAGHADFPLDVARVRRLRRADDDARPDGRASRCRAGGAQALTDALVARFTSLGGEIETGTRGHPGRRTRRRASPASRPATASGTPPAVRRRRRRRAAPLRRLVRDEDLPARRGARDARLRARPRHRQGRLGADRTGPVGRRARRRARHRARRRLRRGDDRRRSARSPSGVVPDRPFLLTGQMTTSDPTRSPAGTESFWAYTHVPQPGATRGDAGGEITRALGPRRPRALRRPDAGAHRGARARLRRPRRAPAACSDRTSSRPATPTSSAAPSTAAPPSCTRSWSSVRCRRCAAARRPAIAGPLPRLGVGPPRRRRARRGRRQRRPRRAVAPPHPRGCGAATSALAARDDLVRAVAPRQPAGLVAAAQRDDRALDPVHRALGVPDGRRAAHEHRPVRARARRPGGRSRSALTPRPRPTRRRARGATRASRSRQVNAPKRISSTWSGSSSASVPQMSRAASCSWTASASTCSS